MTRLSAMILGAGVALASITLAHADPVTGAWRLNVGVNDDPCTVTLGAEGTDAGSVTSTGDCNGVSIAHWKSAGSGLQLLSANGTLVAWLHLRGDSYQGKRIADGRLVALTR